jgi:FkbM family methyltransferase
LQTGTNKLVEQRRISQDALRTATVISEGRRHQVRFRPDTSDRRVISQIIVDRDYDLRRSTRFPEIMRFLDRQRQRGLRPLIVDAGANIGISALYFALVFDAAVVVAIEPEPGNFALLRTNAAGFEIECLQAALASADGMARAFDPGWEAWGFRTERHSEGDIPGVTVDMVHRQFANDDVFPFLVKIDIDGGRRGCFQRKHRMDRANAAPCRRASRLVVAGPRHRAPFSPNDRTGRSRLCAARRKYPVDPA